MTFKPVSKKINKALLGLTMESEFLKKGKSSYVNKTLHCNGLNAFDFSDDDMMSTFSRVSGNAEGDDAMGDDDDDDETITSASSFKNLPVNTSITSQPSDSLVSNMSNGVVDESITQTASNGNRLLMAHNFICHVFPNF